MMVKSNGGYAAVNKTALLFVAPGLLLAPSTCPLGSSWTPYCMQRNVLAEKRSWEQTIQWNSDPQILVGYCSVGAAQGTCWDLAPSLVPLEHILTLYHQFQTLPSPSEHTRNHRQKHLLANTLSQNTKHVSRLPPSLLSLKRSILTLTMTVEECTLANTDHASPHYSKHHHHHVKDINLM